MIAALLLAAAAPDPLLIPLLQRLRLTIPDVRAITDVQVCEVDRRGSQLVAFARPRESRRYYVARWKDGRVTRIMDTGLAGGAEGLASIAVASVEKRFEDCRWVPLVELSAAWSTIDEGGK